MPAILRRGDQGPDVDRLATALRRELGDDAAWFPALARRRGVIDDGFDAAIRRWQAGVGVIADGLVGPRCQVLLGLSDAPGERFAQTPLSVSAVTRLFPATKPANVARYLPYIEAALAAADLTDRAMVVAALGTIRAETEGFVPIAELPSKFNTPAGGAPFSAYEGRRGLGNRQAGDGARFRGRGFVQLTGRANYTRLGERLGLPLAETPDLANAPEVAAVLLAEFLSEQADRVRAAFERADWAAARRAVNGGTHGLDRFKDVVELAAQVWPAAAKAPAGVPLAGRAAGAGRRSGEVARPGGKTRKDAADLRDRLFMPPPLSLPETFPPESEMKDFLPRYTRAGLILDQGREGACTGFGLACVVNYLRWLKAGVPARFESVSPRMLYTLARRHDEYEGEDYDGSTCRGALKGWFHHGVCLESDWPYAPDTSHPARYGFADRATQHTLGVYYRVDTRSITDLQAALAQHRAVFVSAYTHGGWDDVPAARRTAKRQADLPVIRFDGRPSRSDGHAFALVGYNAQGFIVQNSWGRDWGAGGFAVISYLDWLAHAMDAWVVALGVPGVVAGRLASGRDSADAGRARGDGGSTGGADRSRWWDTGLAYRHSVVLGNDGRVARYLTEDEQPRKLQQQAYVLPDQWFRQRPADEPKRVVLYVHGGLNSEDDAIRRASAMGRHFVGNGCYPLFLVWKTGLLESMGNVLGEALRRQPERAGLAGGWLSDRTDLLVEKTIGRPIARPLWSEMKENAELAFLPRHGGELLVDALQALAATWGERFELHLVGHSAGSIALGHLISSLMGRQRAGRDDGLATRLRSVHLYAPACSVAFANRHYAAHSAVMERLHLDVLSDRREREDQVAAVYRKSLLYFVSNCLEADLRTPILGMEKVDDPSYAGWDGTSDTGEALSAWRQAAQAAGLAARRQVLDQEQIEVARVEGGQVVRQAAAHGSFDNDLGVVSRTLERITGSPLASPVDDLRGF